MKSKVSVEVIFVIGLLLVVVTWLISKPGTVIAQEPEPTVKTVIPPQPSKVEQIPESELVPDHISTQATVSTGFTYQGRLTDGGNPANGAYDFEFKLYDAATGGSQVSNVVTRNDIDVSGGLFTVELDFGNAFNGTALWLEIGVRSGSSTGAYTILTPRQLLQATPYAHALRPGAVITSSIPGGIINVGNGAQDGFYVSSVAGDGLQVDSAGDNGVEVNSAGRYGVLAFANQAGVFGGSNSGSGVVGQSYSTPGTGVAGAAFANSGVTRGVYGSSNSPDGYGGQFVNTNAGVALYAAGKGPTKLGAALRVDNAEASSGMATWMLNRSTYHNAHFQNEGSGGILFLENGSTVPDGSGGGDFITAINHGWNDLQFRVTSSGEVRSDVGFFTPAADFAEMLPAVEGLEAGDVLVISIDGKLTRSTEAYQPSVVGVYSTQPGFVGGQPVDEELDGHIPLAVVGVVPVKASAENGSIHPGDLLVASSTPGHTMRCEGVEHCFGRTIGKALEALEGGKGVIQMLVVLQ